MRTIVSNLDVNHLVVSFSNEGYIERDEMVEILETRGQVSVVEKDFKRYVGATIGIHSPKGEKVGEVSHVRNKEYLFVVSKDDSVHKALNQIHCPTQEHKHDHIVTRQSCLWRTEHF